MRMITEKERQPAPGRNRGERNGQPTRPLPRGALLRGRNARVERVLLLQPCRCRTCARGAHAWRWSRQRLSVRARERDARLSGDSDEAAGCEREKHVEMRAAEADESKSMVPRVSFEVVGVASVHMYVEHRLTNRYAGSGEIAIIVLCGPRHGRWTTRHRLSVLCQCSCESEFHCSASMSSKLARRESSIVDSAPHEDRLRP